ncbi:MAG: aminoacyl-tRNA hydrolase [Candidatus Colwellbacteria bacterium]|nr:aminoacyl-tRNA hydrolase [Candidatus Colwellbacteria bacterium]
MFKLFFSRPKIDPSKAGKKDIRIIFGLGNPGKEYALTYHNVGQLFVDYMAKGTFKKYRNFEFSKEDGVIFVKSLTFMNQSGMAAKEALKYFNLKPENLLVAHDDNDILLGQHKFSFDQGPAGHNGVSSIVTHLKTQSFFRERIGVRKNQKTKAGEFILKSMSKTELDILKKVSLEIQNSLISH